MKEFTLTEYEKMGGLLFIGGEFYEELEEYIEDEFFCDNEKHQKEAIDSIYVIGELPIIYGVQQMLIGLDVEDIKEILEEHDYAYEGYKVSDEAEQYIEKFAKNFNEKYAEYSYVPSCDIVIIPTLNELAEICTRLREKRG